MLVRYGPARLAGPAHAGCGFALLPANYPYSHSLRHDPDVYDGQLLTVQYADELDCDALPALKVGDQLGELAGPLNYSFDQWRLLLTDAGSLAVTDGALAEPVRFAPALPGAIRLVSLNLHNYFDDRRDTDHEAEPLVPDEERQKREEKIAAVVADLLGCPTLIAVQEVEKAELLVELARALAPACGFTYGVAHQESVDARGIDVALLYDPTRVRLEGVQTRQACSVVETEVVDEAAGCGPGEWPLFSRPPLFVHLQAEGEPLLVIVVHLKSKRGGEVETEPIRLAQAEALLRWRGGENRPVILVGDVNDYRDSAPLGRLTSGDLHNVLGDLPPEQQYSFIFDGYAQLLDAILVSPELQPLITQVAIQHTNADFPARWELDTTPAHRYFAVSDHDIPLLEWRWPALAGAATATLPAGLATPSLAPPAAAATRILPVPATMTPPPTVALTTTLSGPTAITASAGPDMNTGRSALPWLGAIFCFALLILLTGRKWLIS
jgi:predicted extracellular nuclease